MTGEVCIYSNILKGGNVIQIIQDPVPLKRWKNAASVDLNYKPALHETRYEQKQTHNYTKPLKHDGTGQEFKHHKETFNTVVIAWVTSTLCRHTNSAAQNSTSPEK